MEKSVPNTASAPVREKEAGELATQQPAKVSEAAPAGELLKKERPRTPGLKLFDVFLYPVVTNLSVFGISVAATYLTTRGADLKDNGQLQYGKIGEFFHKRGTWVVKKFEHMGMSTKQADMSKMVLFSFVDGSLMAPVVKVIEDKREDIACYLDRKMGTKPEDLSVYDKEPKQSWLSVLGGRFATAAIVAPTAKLLDSKGWNDKWFIEPGKKFGAKLASKPKIKKLAGRLDLEELISIARFEAFYTSVCTAGLYFSSRGIARMTKDKLHMHHHPYPDDHHADAPAVLPASSSTESPHEVVPAKAHEALKRPRSIDKMSSGYRDKYNAEEAQTPYIGA